MEFGIWANLQLREGQPEHEAFQELVKLAEAADDLGVDCFWLAEFHFRPQTPISAPLLLGSAIASRTKHLNIGIGVSLLPLANPLRLAEECATLDHVSDGRFVYGIGRSSFLDGYEGYGVDYEESRGRFGEALEVIRKAWQPEPFSFEGQYYNFHNVNVVPKPYTQPHPAVRIACESRATFPLMGSLGFPILIRHQMELTEIGDLLNQYDDERRKAGFTDPRNVTLQTVAYVAESSQQARDEAEYSTMYERAHFVRPQEGRYGDAETTARLEGIRTQGTAAYEDIIRRRLYGAPEEMVDRLKEYEETLGITGVSMAVNPGGQIPYDRVVNSVRLIMERVAPHFH
jgi:alkanesulfonate monooxygenase SsuD/methylene tetrahydromethanopterin reductase-like flavin-dependent oxidoreductase (luciferase family)